MSWFRRHRRCASAFALLGVIAETEILRSRRRRFRIRQDGWVRHHGGECPLPPKVRVLIWHRGVDIPLEERADRVPDQWWRHESGKYDVLWFRVLEDWRETPPPIGQVRW